jgi:acetoin utilization deacetylase AcuC-like enzyme
MKSLSTRILVSRGELIVTHSPDHLLHRRQVEFLDQQLVPSFEAPERTDLILRALGDHGLLVPAEVESAEIDLTLVHAPAYVDDLARLCGDFDTSGQSVLPATWPGTGGRVQDDHPPRIRLGRWSRDTFTSVGGGTFISAASSAGCVMAALLALLERGKGAAFALGRPPHHHAGPDYMNGYCYLNGTALAAVMARRMGLQVAVLDIDYHHGNGTQHILYETDILFCSIHGDPRFAFPYFHGFADERGTGTGEGFNLNVPLATGTGWPAYNEALLHVLARVTAHAPDVLIISLGVDTFSRDPVGRFALGTADFSKIGHTLSAAGALVLFVMEGGYAVQEIGANVAGVLTGFSS